MKYMEKKKKWITIYYGKSYNAKTEIVERLAKLRISRRYMIFHLGFFVFRLFYFLFDIISNVSTLALFCNV